MRTLVRALGHPEQRFPSVLIAGTNGKGSTSATLASILMASGYRTGLYTSPHLIRPNERIRIDGQAIDDDDFAEIYGRVQDCVAQLMDAGSLPQAASFFETMTAMGFLYFAESGVDVAVLEVGLGGRLDATNVVEPLISVITDIDLDHQQWLGNTLPEIAREKAGVMRRNGPVVMLPQHPAVTQALGEAAMALEARAVNATEHLPDMTRGATADAGRSRVTSRVSRTAEVDGYEVQWLGETVRVASPLHGRHQWRNIALALATAAELKTNFGFEQITADAVERGVRDTRWPGRLQTIYKDGRRWLLDVAHNPAGAWALRAALSELESPVTLVFGAMADKEIRDIATVLFPVAERVVLTRANTARAAQPEQLAKAAAHTGSEFLFSASVVEGLRIAAEATPGPKGPSDGPADLPGVDAGVYPTASVSTGAYPKRSVSARDAEGRGVSTGIAPESGVNAGIYLGHDSQDANAGGLRDGSAHADAETDPAGDSVNSRDDGASGTSALGTIVVTGSVFVVGEALAILDPESAR
jgi:dihydrofolate synthase/folylpolyglutamate synthase